MVEHQLEFISIANSIAKESTVNVKHGAIIVCEGKVVATGFNKTEGARKKLMKFYGPCEIGKTIHAEYDVITNLLGITRFGTDNINIRRKKMDIYVARDNMKNSKPCIHCINILRHFGIYRVFYTIDVNEYICEKVNQIENCHISYGNKNIK